MKKLSVLAVTAALCISATGYALAQENIGTVRQPLVGGSVIDESQRGISAATKLEDWIDYAT